MSIQRFEPGDIETFSIQAAPSTAFASSSTGLTGAVYVYPRRSETIKDLHINWNTVVGVPTGAFAEINDISGFLNQARTATTPAQLTANITQYLNMAGQQPQSLRNLQKQEIIRFNTGFNLDRDMTRKFVVTNLLMPYYNKFGTSYDFAYTNYNSLNFLTASGLPTGSALLYPASSSAASIGSIISSSYIPSGAFSFDFWINPRYTTDTPTSEFKAGTIMHVSGTHAVSLLTGSSKDSNGYADKYRLLVQLSSSADIKPSSVNPALPTGLIFLSDDNCLNKNQWHHVTVRWGTSTYNFGSGSFIIDGNERGTFYIPSSSIAPRRRTSVDMPNMLTVGNYFQKDVGSADLFFSTLAQTRYGVPVTGSSFTASQAVDQPTNSLLEHPLNAEINELKVYSKYLTDSEILSRSSTGADLSSDLLFYLPPLFTKESPYRTVTASLGNTDYLGGVLAHPFENINGTTTQPFNTFLSFDTGGHLINLENYTRDFATGNYPRLFNLDATVIRNNTAQLSANQFLYATGSNKKASLAVLPCDNGYFTPNYFSLLSRLSGASFTNDNGDRSYNLISLRNMYSSEEVYDIVTDTTASSLLNIGADGTIINSLSGLNATKSIGELDQQRVPSILQQTKENSSLQVTMFDISNLFYGNKIKPTSFTITDNDLSNSGGKVGITLKDDGYGCLYRADSVGGVFATNNSVGNIFYDNGLVLIKNPSLYFFGKNGFSCTFEGERNIHVLKMDLYANPLQLVSSSNPSWNPSLKASDLLSDYDKRYVYITDLYVHDDNLNVIAKTKLASPVLKRTGDRLVFHVKIDF